MHTYTHTHTYTRTHIHTHTNTHIHPHIHTHARTHTYMHKKVISVQISTPYSVHVCRWARRRGRVLLSSLCAYCLTIRLKCVSIAKIHNSEASAHALFRHYETTPLTYHTMVPLKMTEESASDAKRTSAIAQQSAQILRILRGYRTKIPL